MADSSLVQIEIELQTAAIAEKRRQDILIYLALSSSSHRPKIEDLPTEFQNDIKALFDTYGQACEEAEQMLLCLRYPQGKRILSIRQHQSQQAQVQSH